MNNKQRNWPQVTPLGWALPVVIGVAMFTATGAVSIADEDRLHPEIARSIDALQVKPIAYDPLVSQVTNVSDLQKACIPEVEAVPLATAVVELEILSPCDPGVAVDVQHEGLRIGAILDDVGRVIVTLPTLRKDAAYRVTIEGREPVISDGTALDFPAFSRTVLLAPPDTGFELHAYEGDASFGEPGHVQPGQPYDPVRALVGAGGFLAKAGTPSLLGSEVAQVYTAPAQTQAHLQLEAEVTASNCGREIRAVTIRPTPMGAPVVTPWQLRMPGCEALGEVVLLGKIAQ